MLLQFVGESLELPDRDRDRMRDGRGYAAFLRGAYEPNTLRGHSIDKRHLYNHEHTHVHDNLRGPRKLRDYCVRIFSRIRLTGTCHEPWPSSSSPRIQADERRA